MSLQPTTAHPTNHGHNMALIKHDCLSPRDTIKQTVQPPNIKKAYAAAKKRRHDELDMTDILPLRIF